MLPKCNNPLPGVSQKKNNGLKLAEVETTGGSVLVPYEVRRSRRSRYIRLTIGSHNHALLSVPWRCPLPEAMKFLRSQGDWIEKNLRQNPTRTSLFEYLQKHPRLYGLGHCLRLTLGFTGVKPFYVYSLDSGEVELRIRQSDHTDVETKALVRAFAAEVIEKRTRELAANCGVKVARVSTRDQSSRWGSCSSSRTISLNWRLVLMRSDLQDHIIYHELAHLTEMNHSKAFWDLLNQYDPKTRLHNGQLNPAASRLMSLGR